MKTQLLILAASMLAVSSCKKEEEEEEVNPFMATYTVSTVAASEDNLNTMVVNDAKEVMIGNNVVKKLYHTTDLENFETFDLSERFVQLFARDGHDFSFTSFAGIYTYNGQTFERTMYAHSMYLVDINDVVGIQLSPQSLDYDLLDANYGVEYSANFGLNNTSPQYVRNDSLFFNSNLQGWVHHFSLPNAIQIENKIEYVNRVHAKSNYNELVIDQGEFWLGSEVGNVHDFDSEEFIAGDVKGRRVVLVSENKIIANLSDDIDFFGVVSVEGISSSQKPFITAKLYDENTLLITNDRGKLIKVDFDF